ncbi:Hypothetical_protein [Hexamita inflata]|uniref:Hypothetical_protein n=1 Tax=Hexamita inflata TaxID=28002 RepID=A0ABP1GGN8_9EUKA
MNVEDLLELKTQIQQIKYSVKLANEQLKQQSNLNASNMEQFSQLIDAGFQNNGQVIESQLLKLSQQQLNYLQSKVQGFQDISKQFAQSGLQQSLIAKNIKTPDLITQKPRNQIIIQRTHNYSIVDLDDQQNLSQPQHPSSFMRKQLTRVDSDAQLVKKKNQSFDLASEISQHVSDDESFSFEPNIAPLSKQYSIVDLDDVHSQRFDNTSNAQSRLKQQAQVDDLQDTDTDSQGNFASFEQSKVNLLGSVIYSKSQGQVKPEFVIQMKEELLDIKQTLESLKVLMVVNAPNFPTQEEIMIKLKLKASTNFSLSTLKTELYGSVDNFQLSKVLEPKLFTDYTQLVVKSKKIFTIKTDMETFGLFLNSKMKEAMEITHNLSVKLASKAQLDVKIFQQLKYQCQKIADQNKIIDDISKTQNSLVVKSKESENSVLQTKKMYFKGLKLIQKSVQTQIDDQEHYLSQKIEKLFEKVLIIERKSRMVANISGSVRLQDSQRIISKPIQNTQQQNPSPSPQLIQLNPNSLALSAIDDYLNQINPQPLQTLQSPQQQLPPQVPLQQPQNQPQIDLSVLRRPFNTFMQRIQFDAETNLKKITNLNSKLINVTTSFLQFISENNNNNNSSKQNQNQSQELFQQLFRSVQLQNKQLQTSGLGINQQLARLSSLNNRLQKVEQNISIVKNQISIKSNYTPEPKQATPIQLAPVQPAKSIFNPNNSFKRVFTTDDAQILFNQFSENLTLENTLFVDSLQKIVQHLNERMNEVENKIQSKMQRVTNRINTPIEPTTSKYPPLKKFIQTNSQFTVSPNIPTPQQLKDIRTKLFKEAKQMNQLTKNNVQQMQKLWTEARKMFGTQILGQIQETLKLPPVESGISYERAVKNYLITNWDLQIESYIFALFTERFFTSNNKNIFLGYKRSNGAFNNTKLYNSDQPDIYPLGLVWLHINLLLVVYDYEIDVNTAEKNKIVVGPSMKSGLSEVKMPLIQLGENEIK